MLRRLGRVTLLPLAAAMPVNEAAAQDPLGGAILGGTAGAIIGGIAGGGRGAAIGAGVGGAPGAIIGAGSPRRRGGPTARRRVLLWAAGLLHGAAIRRLGSSFIALLRCRLLPACPTGSRRPYPVLHATLLFLPARESK